MESLQVIDSRIYSLVILYDMHTDFFKNALDGISDDDAHKRLDTKANHVVWLAGSLVEQRFEIAGILGVDKQHGAHDLFKDNQGIKEGLRYPPLATFINDWETVTPLLRDALVKVEAAKLDTTFEMMPGMQMSNFDLISFCIYREANCIGQIALWRRLLGYEAMKYM